MKIVVFNGKGFVFSEKNVEKVRLASGASVVQVGDDPENVVKEIGDADVFVTHNCSFSPEVFEAARKLRYVHSLAAGVEKLLSCIPEDVLIANAKGVHSINIGEHVLGFMLMLEHRFGETMRAQLRKKWVAKELFMNGGKCPGELFGKTVAVFGFGNIGRRVGELSSKVGMRVLGVRSRKADKPDFVDEMFTLSDCEGALRNSDYVVAALPQTKETRRFFDESKFSLMKNSAFFINVGRGSVANEEHLMEALKSGNVAGAALDVFETEPLPDSSELWGMENVIITPHSAGFTPHYMDRFTDVFCENLKAFVEGGPLPNEVDRDKGY